ERASEARAPQDDVGLLFGAVRPADAVFGYFRKHRQPFQSAAFAHRPYRRRDRQAGNRNDGPRWEALAHAFLHQRHGGPAKLRRKRLVAELRLATRDPCGRRDMRYFVEKLDGGNTPTDDDYMLSGEFMRRMIVL